MSLKMHMAKLKIHMADVLGAHITQKDQPRTSQQGRVGPEPQEGPGWPLQDSSEATWDVR